MGLTQVSTDGVKNDAITKTKIPANQIEASELADNAVDTNAISNDAVTFDKIENVAQNVFLGRLNSGNGNIEPLSATQTRTLLNVANGATNSPTTIINNNADNRLITGSGTANTLNGESQLTYDNSTNILKAASASSTSTDTNLFHVVGGGTATRGIMFGTGRATGAAQNHAMGYIDSIDTESNSYGAQLQFRLGGTRVMVIGYNSNDNVGIGNDYPLKKLTVQADQNTHGIFLTNDNDYDSGWGFHADSSSGALKIDRSINNNFGYRRATFHQDGGLCFGQDTAAANALDDYEEGTWNVTSFNYDYDGNQAQRGHYIKVGRIVHAFFRVKFHTQTNYTGQHLRFTGLPFTSASGSPYDFNVCGIAHGYGSVDFFRVYIQPGSTYAYWYTSTGNNFNNSTSLNNADVRGCITYTAAS